MHSILPPYGVILRSAMASGDQKIIQAFAKYSEWMMKHNIDLSEDDRANWEDAHKELVAATK